MPKYGVSLAQTFSYKNRIVGWARENPYAGIFYASIFIKHGSVQAIPFKYPS